jgi:uncharacterized membrane protein
MRTFAIVMGVTALIVSPAIVWGAFLIWFGINNCPVLADGTMFIGCN